jgi:hypothetical protein
MVTPYRLLAGQVIVHEAKGNVNSENRPMNGDAKLPQVIHIVVFAFLLSANWNTVHVGAAMRCFDRGHDDSYAIRAFHRLASRPFETVWDHR